jgi:superfamily II DNA helicase RecQ
MAYHAGLSATQRQQVSTALVARKVSLVACTSSLSSGLDCSAIDAIIHYSLPSSLEEYVQQVRLRSSIWQID